MPKQGILVILVVAFLTSLILVSFTGCFQKGEPKFNVNIFLSGKEINEKQWFLEELKLYNGDLILGRNYFEQSKSTAISAAMHFTDFDAIEYDSKIVSYEEAKSQLEGLFYKWQSEFDIFHNRFMEFTNPDNRNDWYEYIKSSFKKSNVFEVDYLKEFIRAFERAYGTLNNSDGDGVPDVEDKYPNSKPGENGSPDRLEEHWK